MRIFLIITFLLLGHPAVKSQTTQAVPPDRAQQIGQLRSAVGTLVSKQSKAKILLNDFNVVEGKVVALSDDSFSLKIKKIGGGSGRNKAAIKVPFKDVLAISSKLISISVIPDPNLRSYGSWDDVLALNYNHALEVVMENGETGSGRLGEKTKDKIILIGETPDEKFSVPREKIVSLYKVPGVYRQSGDRSIRKAAGGAKKGREVGDVIGGTPDGKAFSAALGAGIGALIGAMTGAVSGGGKTPRMRLLIYSK
jgi:hypothetical protein